MKISVIVPCYNVEQYVRECMTSLLTQSIGKESLEIILVDDCSTDQTVSVLKEYEASHPEQIILILSERNGRQGTARNIGLQYATGEFVSFVDADDRVHPRMFEILSSFSSENNLDLLQFRYIDSSKAAPDAPLPELQVYDISARENRRKFLLRTDILGQSCTTLFYKRDLLQKAKVKFAEGLAYEEPLFTYPLKFYANTVGVLEYPLYYYRFNEHGTTASYMSKVSTITDHLIVQQELLQFMRDTSFYPDYKNEIELYHLHSFFAEPFYFLRYRGIDLPAPLFRYMATQVETFIPDYQENPYLSDPSLREENALIELIKSLKGADDDTVQKTLGSLKLTF